LKKDIPDLKVEDFAIALLPKEDDPDFWEVYVINLMEEPIKSVLVTATAFGEINGTERKSAMMRYFFEELTALDMQLLEHLPSNLLNLTNEYWVSFSYGGQLWDKRFLVVPGSLDPINFIPIPFINREGILKR
jgi:hypothetical protein